MPSTVTRPATAARYLTPCEHYTEGQGRCGATPTRHFMTGHKCQQHTPAAVNGRDENRPDPAHSAEALRERAQAARAAAGSQ